MIHLCLLKSADPDAFDGKAPPDARLDAAAALIIFL
jgi:hypothetical protein